MIPWGQNRFLGEPGQSPVVEARKPELTGEQA